MSLNANFYAAGSPVGGHKASITTTTSRAEAKGMHDGGPATQADDKAAQASSAGESGMSFMNTFDMTTGSGRGLVSLRRIMESGSTPDGPRSGADLNAAAAAAGEASSNEVEMVILGMEDGQTLDKISPRGREDVGRSHQLITFHRKAKDPFTEAEYRSGRCVPGPGADRAMLRSRVPMMTAIASPFEGLTSGNSSVVPTAAAAAERPSEGRLSSDSYVTISGKIAVRDRSQSNSISQQNLASGTGGGGGGASRAASLGE